MTSLVIASVNFLDDETVVVAYINTATDVRNRGLLMQTHQLQISAGDGGADYGDEIEDIREAIVRLLDDALDDFANTEAVDPDAAMGEDDDERSQDD